MDAPIEPTKFHHNPYDESWFESDFFHTPDGIGKFPEHHCKLTFEISFPFIKSFRNAVDIGCRDGEYSRYLQKHFSKTFAFDPRMRENFAYNVDLTNVVHFTCALGDQPGKIDMYGGTHRNVSRLKRLLSRNARKVPVYTLDSFKLIDVDYIKVDVEGFEKKVLVGAKDTIAKYRPLIVIEQNGEHLSGEEPFAAKRFLERLGYKHVATCPRGWDHVMSPE